MKIILYQHFSKKGQNREKKVENQKSAKPAFLEFWTKNWKILKKSKSAKIKCRTFFSSKNEKSGKNQKVQKYIFWNFFNQKLKNPKKFKSIKKIHLFKNTDFLNRSGLILPTLEVRAIN